MGSIAVQAKYEKTADPKRMLTHALLNEAILKDLKNVGGFLPARTATFLEYKAGATTAMAWNEGEGKISINLPLQNGWYVPDGNPFAIPNGRPTKAYEQDALCLYRYQDRDFSGPLWRVGWAGIKRFDVMAYNYGSTVLGVALIGCDATVGLQLVRNPTELIVKGTPEQLDAAVRLLESLKQ
ncbi:MAG: hypothetical protein PHV13_02590 [Candidatus ainarchaeum sp.]|nr:hypothetical protein [Candidatus ainarchaeum sp.]